MFKAYYAKGFRFGSHFPFGSSGCTFQFMGPLFLFKLLVEGLGLGFSLPENLLLRDQGYIL